MSLFDVEPGFEYMITEDCGGYKQESKIYKVGSKQKHSNHCISYFCSCPVEGTVDQSYGIYLWEYEHSSDPSYRKIVNMERVLC